MVASCAGSQRTAPAKHRGAIIGQRPADLKAVAVADGGGPIFRFLKIGTPPAHSPLPVGTPVWLREPTTPRGGVKGVVLASAGTTHLCTAHVDQHTTEPLEESLPRQPLRRTIASSAGSPPAYRGPNPLWHESCFFRSLKG